MRNISKSHAQRSLVALETKEPGTRNCVEERSQRMQSRRRASSPGASSENKPKVTPLERKPTYVSVGDEQEDGKATTGVTLSKKLQSKKLQSMIKRQLTLEEERSKFKSNVPKYEARNWKQLTDKQLSKMTPIERSRYMAYEPPAKEIEERRMESLRRVREAKALEREQNAGQELTEMIDYEQNSELVGQLKSAEARDRIRTMKLAYQHNRIAELNHLIASQPTSIQAVRLKSFIPPNEQLPEVPEILSRKERIRCEVLLEDDKGLTINRT